MTVDAADADGPHGFAAVFCAGCDTLLTTTEYTDHACCRLERVEIDGEVITVRVQGTAPMTDEDRHALAELVHAIRAQGRA